MVDYSAESDDYSIYLKVWLDNDNYDSPLFGVFDTEKKAKAARWHDRNDNVRVFDIIKISRKGGKAVFGAEDEYILCDWCNKGIGTLEDLESGSVEYLGKGGDIVCMTCVTKRGIPYDVSHAEWHHSNTACHECGSDDVDYTKVYYCSQCGEDDLVPGEQCSCGNLVGSKDYYEQMICGDCDNAWIEDDYSAETFEAPRKSVSVSRRKKNNKISKTISDIMHSWEKTGMIGKNRPRSRKSAQKMAIAVAYSINNRKTTKKAETFGAEYVHPNQPTKGRATSSPVIWDSKKGQLIDPPMFTVWVGNDTEHFNTFEEALEFAKNDIEEDEEAQITISYYATLKDAETFENLNPKCIYMTNPKEASWVGFPLIEGKGQTDCYDLGYDMCESCGDFYGYDAETFEALYAEEGNTPVMPPMDFGEMAKWRPLDGTPGLKRNRAENYKHECITCAEGMDELVAKGQTWSCECCGFLVGTQGKHEGCGFNNDGEIMCSLCYSGQCDCDSFSAEMIECGNCDATFSIDEGLDIGGIDYCEECYDTLMSKEDFEAQSLKDLLSLIATELPAGPCDECGQTGIRDLNHHLAFVCPAITDPILRQKLIDAYHNLQ